MKSSPRWAAVEPRAFQLSEACRAAWLSFGKGGAWGKPELAAWLVGGYAAAIARSKQLFPPVSGSIPPEAKRPSSIPPPSAEQETLDDAAVTSLVEKARTELFAALEKLEGGDQSFVSYVVQLGYAGILPLETGRELLLPRTRTRMRLTDRLLTLLACDLLAAPEDFRDLHACAKCLVVGFDGTCPHDRRNVATDDF